MDCQEGTVLGIPKFQPPFPLEWMMAIDLGPWFMVVARGWWPETLLAIWVRGGSFLDSPTNWYLATGMVGMCGTRLWILVVEVT